MTQFSTTQDEIRTSCEGPSVTSDPALGFMFDLPRWCSSSKPQTRADSMELCRGASSYVPDHTETSVVTDGPPLPDALSRVYSHISGRSGTSITCPALTCPKRPTEE